MPLAQARTSRNRRWSRLEWTADRARYVVKLPRAAPRLMPGRPEPLLPPVPTRGAPGRGPQVAATPARTHDFSFVRAGRTVPVGLPNRLGYLVCGTPEGAVSLALTPPHCAGGPTITPTSSSSTSGTTAIGSMNLAVVPLCVAAAVLEVGPAQGSSDRPASTPTCSGLRRARTATTAFGGRKTRLWPPAPGPSTSY